MESKKISEKNLEKLKIFFLILISILLLISILQRSGIFGNVFKIANTNKKILNNNEMLILEDGTVSKTVNSSEWDTNKVTAVTDADGKIVPVPKGYTGSNATGENKVDEGFVIYEGDSPVNDDVDVFEEQITRNQWVWIPVDDPSRVYEEINGVKKAKLYTYDLSGRSKYENKNLEPAILSECDTESNLSNNGLTGMTPDKLYQELQKEFDETMNSIEKYGGFYIGRYETGNLSEAKPVVQKMNGDIWDQNWYSMYSKMGYLAANENVKTNMIWGCLWDETLQCLIERKGKDKEIHMSYTFLSSYVCSYIGNYFNSSFSYIDDSFNTVTKQVNTYQGIPTGASDYTNYFNIYDLAGNAWENTLEAEGSKYRTFRGGNVWEESGTLPVSSRVGVSPTEIAGWSGTRAYLYIK